MHQGSLSEIQGVSPQRGASPRRTTRLSGGYTQRSLCLPRGAPLWAWLVVGVLVLPGAWSYLSEEQEEMLVELHNHYRGQVTPSASAMLPLKWDPNLKLIAESYAAKCIWNHNAELEDTGENLYAGTGPLDLREALEKWFLEYMHYDYQNNSCNEDMMCGHYTQMVWADTHRVGCAFHLCNRMENLDWERVSFLVCNYYPAGNYEDQRPYVEGDWCSSCPENLQKCENNLCVPETVDDEEDSEEEEEGTVVPPPATSDPTLQSSAEQDEAEGATPPSATSSSYVQPATTAAGDTEDAGGAVDTEDTEDAEDAEDADNAEDAVDTENTPPPAIPDPDKPPTTLESEENVEEKKEEEAKKTEDESRKDIRDNTKEKVERDEARKIYQRKESVLNAGSVCSSSLLFACLIAILTTRL